MQAKFTWRGRYKLACFKETIQVNMLESDGTHWNAWWTIAEDNFERTILVDSF